MDTEQSQTPPQPESNDDTPQDQEVDEAQRLAAELVDLRDRYMRTAAEMENMRRRFDRDRGELVKYALENTFKDILPVLDSFERALPDGTDSDSKGSDPSFVEGMKMVKRQLIEVLKKHGLEPLVAAGAAFDPNLHQGIQRVESSDVTAETVGSEFAKGYLLNGRLLRPAMVSVLIPADG